MTSSVSGHQRSKRLRSELACFRSECDNAQLQLYTLETTTEDLSTWTISLMPGEDSMYHGKTLELQISFPQQYPREPPIVRFLSSLYHPNVTSAGLVNGDVLTDDWSPVMTAHGVILCMLNLLDQPDLRGEVINGAAASMFLTHPEDYRAIAKTKLEN